MPLLKNVLKKLLHKWFDIREGEYRSAVLMQLNIFLLISTLLIVKPNVTALFLDRFGAERLPEAFVLVALTALVLSQLYAKLLIKKKFNLIIERTLLISFIVFIIFLTLLKISIVEGIALYSFYIWIAVFALLATSQFWVLANLVYNIREAKRIFSFIGAGAISGGIFGGYLTTVLAPVIGSENVLLIAAILLLLCIPVTRIIWNENVASISIFRRKKRFQGPAENPVKIILRSRHLLYLAGIIGISVIVAKIVDYQFSDIAHRSISDPDELAAFFGFWFSTLNLLSLFIQLFITPMIVGIWGVGVSLLFLPAGILLGAITLFLLPGLATATLLRVVDGSFKQSINKASIELLSLPIPIEIKNRTKTFIDVVVDSIATGLAGFILIFIINGLEISTRYVSLFILLLIGLWIYLVSKIRKEYIKSFKNELLKTTDDTKPDLIPTPESILQGIESVLESGSEEQIVYMLKKVREIKNDHLFSPVRKLINHPSQHVRAEAIRTLYQYQSESLVDEIKPFIDDPDTQVKLAAFEYLFEHAEEATFQIFDQYLDHPDQDIAKSALVSLAIETRNNQTLKKIYQLEHRVQSKLDSIAKDKNAESAITQTCWILEIIGHADLSEFFPFISKCLKSRQPTIVKAAIRSAGLTLNSLFVKSLAEFLKNEEYYESARTALVGYGIPIIDNLLEIAENTSTSPEVRRRIPSIINCFNSQQAVNALFKLVYYDEQDVKLEAIRCLKNLKLVDSDLNFHKNRIAKLILEEGQLYLDTLSAMYAEIIVNYKKRKDTEDIRHEDEARKELIKILEQRLDSDLEFIFRLLDLKYPTEDIDVAYNGIQSENPEHRANAIEFLDNLLEPDLKRILIPIVETTVIDSISETTLRSLSLNIPSEKECLETLLSRNDQEIVKAVFDLISVMGDQTYVAMVKKYTKSSEPTVRNHAKKVLLHISDREST